MAKELHDATMRLCKRGHPLTEENSKWHRGKYGMLRKCRKCQNARERKRTARQQSFEFDQ